MQESKNLFLLNLCFLSNFSFFFFLIFSYISSFLPSSPPSSCLVLPCLFSKLSFFLPSSVSSFFLACFLLYLSIMSVHLFIVSYGQKCSNIRNSTCCQLPLFSEDGVAGRRQVVNCVFGYVFHHWLQGTQNNFTIWGKKDLRKKIL